MGLHRLTDITIGVPNVEETAGYYREFGLTPSGEGHGHRFAHLVLVESQRAILTCGPAAFSASEWWDPMASTRATALPAACSK